jgi:nucleotide-binding universal stress UspA family protein
MAGAAQASGRIVVGIDGSAASAEALRWAARQAELTGSPLEVIMTWEWPASLGWSVPIPQGYDPEADVRQIVDHAVDAALAERPGITVDRRVVNGHPSLVLVDATKGADLLVIGSRGHGEFVGMLLGSVSEFCTKNAHCPVLVHRAVT